MAARIEGAFTAVEDKVKAEQRQELQRFRERLTLLREYEKVQPQILEVAKPRLEALAKRAGDRAPVTPSASDTRRSARLEVQSPKALMTPTFSVAPYRQITRAVVHQVWVPTLERPEGP